MSALIRRRRFTVDDYHRMGDAGILLEDDRVELIYGEIIAMSPIGNPHNAAVDRATRALVRTVGDNADIVLLKPRDDFYANGGANPDDIILIIEMADSSLKYDRRLKARLYAEMGVPEYWVSDLNAGCVYCYSERHEKYYRLVRQFKKGESITPGLLPECSIPVDNLLP
jgi:Uma2 family endonuclease